MCCMCHVHAADLVTSTATINIDCSNLEQIKFSNSIKTLPTAKLNLIPSVYTLHTYIHTHTHNIPITVYMLGAILHIANFCGT